MGRSYVFSVNEEFAERYRIRTTLVDFLPGLVAPRVGVFVTELGQQTRCVKREELQALF